MSTANLTVEPELPKRARPRAPMSAQTRLSRRRLRRIAAACGGPRVSIYMPTHERGDQVQQDPIRLQSLLRDAGRRLDAEGMPAGRIDAILSPARGLLRDRAFWRYGHRGLAVLLAPDEPPVALGLPYAVETSCIVDGRFRVAPLVEMSRPDAFNLIAFSQTNVRLFHGDRGTIEELALGDVPPDLVSVLGGEPAGATLQCHTVSSGPAGRQAAMFHGHGAGHDDRGHELSAFVRRIASTAPARFPNPGAPLVLAAVERTVAEYRRLAPTQPLTPTAVLGDPTRLSPDALHRAAWSCAEPVLREPTRQAIHRVEEAQGTSMASVEIDRVLSSCRGGNVAVLLAAIDDPVAGRAEEGAELVDLAIAYALGCDADVHRVHRDEMPAGGPLAALHRFPC